MAKRCVVWLFAVLRCKDTLLVLTLQPFGYFFFKKNCPTLCSVGSQNLNTNNTSY